MILTFITYVLTYSIEVGFITRLDFFKVMKVGRAPVTESSTDYMLVLAPESGSIISGNI